MSTMTINQFFETHGIPYEMFEHAAVFTVEESLKLPSMPGMGTKNLFLRDSKGTRIFLVTVGHDTRVDLKALQSILDIDKLSFASAETLKELLGVEPGSVTLLGLINDSERKVEVVIDRDLWAADLLQCHPLRNTATTVLSHEALEKFLRATGHAPKVIEVPVKEVSSMKVLVFGTFDQLHTGHHFVLQEAMKRGHVTVIVARDHNVERIKGRSPVQSEGERARAIQKAFPEATVAPGDSDDFLVPVKTLHPDLILLGYDQKLPPGVTDKDFPCPVERLPAFEPSIYKSSLL